MKIITNTQTMHAAADDCRAVPMTRHSFITLFAVCHEKSISANKKSHGTISSQRQGQVLNYCHQSWSSLSCSAPRTGQLAAVQAKNLLLGTGLAQQTLAGVWNLADIDKDGRCNTFSLK